MPETILSQSNKNNVKNVSRHSVVNVDSPKTDPNYYKIDTSSLDGNSSYQALLSANPYNNYDYRPDVWDKIGHFFGFRTNEDQVRESMQQASREYESQLVSMNREESYNSELEQVMRQREAGLNPDLNGVSSGQASEFNEPEQSPIIPAGSNEFLQNVVGSVFTACTTLVGLSKDFKTLNSMKLANDAQRMENLDTLLRVSKNYNDLRMNDHGINTMYVPQFELGNRKLARKFSNMLDLHQSSLDNDISYYSKKANKVKNRKGYFEEKNQFYSEDDDQLNEVMSCFGDLVEQVTISQMKYQHKKNDNDYTREAKADELNLPEGRAIVEGDELQYKDAQIRANSAEGLPSREASAKGAEFDFKAQQSQMFEDIQAKFAETIHKLKSKADDGNNMAYIAMIVLSMIQQGYTPKF